MIAWTDRHCRFFLRQISRRARLYTEMIPTGALIHGDAARYLAFDPAEHPVAIQLGGSDPEALARCARMAARRGYDEVNLNVGCPSERVQNGSFGACLMGDPALVARCAGAMADAVSVPVTIKHRIGIDQVEEYSFVRDFVGTVALAGPRVFIVHARNAILKGLSPKENREVPPLRYEVVYRLKRDFPELTFVINGGITSHAEVARHLAHVDGVMIGRQAYHDPYWLAQVDRRWFDANATVVPRHEIAARLRAHALRELAGGVPLRSIVRHALGLYLGEPGARTWRRILSDPARLAAGITALDEALAAVDKARAEAESALAAPT